MKIFKKRPMGFGEGVEPVPKWGILVPHTEKAQGAVTTEGQTEYDYGVRLAVNFYNAGIPIANRNNGLKKGFKELRKQGVTASLEPHFNSFNGRAKGAEILVLKGDTRSYRIAELCLEILDDSDEFYPDKDDNPRRIRGVKEVAKGDRGYKNLKAAKDSGMDIALLSELFFGDNYFDYMSEEMQYKFWREALNI